MNRCRREILAAIEAEIPTGDLAPRADLAVLCTMCAPCGVRGAFLRGFGYVAAMASPVSSSIEVMMSRSFFAVISAVTTWITADRGDCKGVVTEIGLGEGMAMRPLGCQEVSVNVAVWRKTWAQEGSSGRGALIVAEHRRSSARGWRNPQNPVPVDEGAGVRCCIP